MLQRPRAFDFYLTRHGIEQRMQFCIVVKIDEHIALAPIGNGLVDESLAIRHDFAPCPTGDLARPDAKRGFVITAGVQSLGPMEAAIREITRQVGQQRPVHGIRTYKRNIEPPQ